MRFKVGEPAIIAADFSGRWPDLIGKTTVIKEFIEERYRDGGRFDYVIENPNACWNLVCSDLELRKIDPPAEPLSLTRVEELETV